MFNFISWQLFLTALTLLIVAYYLITTPLLFFKEIAAKIKSSPHPTPSVEPAREPHTKLQDNLMGTANEVTVTPKHKTITTPGPEDFITNGSDDESDFIDEAAIKNELLIGSVADLLQEIKNLLLLIAEDRTGKTESKALFNALFIRYPHLHNTSYSQAINFYLLNEEKDKFSFELTAEELQSWWTPSTTSPTENNH